MPNIREMQRRLCQWAADHAEGQYRDLFNLICDYNWLYQAYRNIADNKGASTPGVDGLTRIHWDKEIESNMAQLLDDLRMGKYRPQPCRRVYIPKKSGTLRPLGIPALRDRIVQEAIRMAIEPIFETDFHDYSFGFRPQRSTHDAIEQLRFHLIERKRMYYVIEGDIKGCFDAIHHRKLMQLLRRRIGDKRVLAIIWSFLKAGVMEKGLFSPTEQGTPQGGVISPLLSNIYLHELDRFIYSRFQSRHKRERERCRNHGGNNANFVRYADDFVVTCNGHIRDVRQLKEDIAKFLAEELHLTLSPEKTLITHVNDGFDFLGFHFQRGTSAKGKCCIKTTIPQKNVERVKEKIRILTEHDHTYLCEVVIISKINQLLRGWGNYYRYQCVSETFAETDHFVFWRLIQWYRNKHRWSKRETILKRFNQKAGDKRLFAAWDGAEGARRTYLFILVRDIKRQRYYRRKKQNPFLVDTLPIEEAIAMESRMR